jgi:hypothetical protein
MDDGLQLTNGSRGQVAVGRRGSKRVGGRGSRERDGRTDEASRSARVVESWVGWSGGVRSWEPS